jgi:hypothetical protein
MTTAPQGLARLQQELERRYLRPIDPPPNVYDLEETYRSLLEEPMATISSRHLRRAPWVIFDAQKDGHPRLIDDRQFLSAYLQRLRDAGSSTILALLGCFLLYYPRQAPLFDALRNALATKLLPLANSPRGQRQQDYATHFHLLAADGPERFGQMLYVHPQPDKLLVDAGLTGQLASGEFVALAYRTTLQQLSKKLAHGELDTRTLDKHLSFAANNTEQDFRLRFPQAKSRLAEALLLPYSNSSPSPEHQAAIKAFLLEHYKDPRLHRGRWQGIHDDARNVMFRWLVGTTLKDFFRLLDHASKQNRDFDRHWKYRKEFWSAYLDAGHIVDAWVALGPKVGVEARNLLSDSRGQYADLLRGSGVNPLHSVLILRIDNLVITEWSHIGKYRVWYASSGTKPKFYQSRYTRQGLISQPDFEGIHSSSESYSWQSKLSSYILNQTGIAFPYPDLFRNSYRRPVHSGKRRASRARFR